MVRLSACRRRQLDPLDPRRRAYYMGGTPSWWRLLNQDARTDPAWKAVYKSMDAIQPWSVGRYGDDAGIEHWRKNAMVPDLAEAKANGNFHLPVAFPGFSWKNLNAGPAPCPTPFPSVQATPPLCARRFPARLRLPCSPLWRAGMGKSLSEGGKRPGPCACWTPRAVACAPWLCAMARRAGIAAIRPAVGFLRDFIWSTWFPR